MKRTIGLKKVWNGHGWSYIKKGEVKQIVEPEPVAKKPIKVKKTVKKSIFKKKVSKKKD